MNQNSWSVRALSKFSPGEKKKKKNFFDFDDDGTDEKVSTLRIQNSVPKTKDTVHWLPNACTDGFVSMSSGNYLANNTTSYR